MEIKAYCIKCMCKKTMEDPKAVKIGPGLKMGFVGKCPNCDRQIFTLNREKYLQEIWGRK